jgi:hypothetical protein
MPYDEDHYRINAMQADDARQERERAELTDQDVEAQWEEIRAIVGPLKLMRKENHFAEQIKLVFGS